MRYRAVVIPVLGVILLLGGYLVYGNLNNNLVYYLTPTEAVAKQADFGQDRRFRLGGLVEKGSVQRTADWVRFVVADDKTKVQVSHTGAPAQLFRAGVGVIVEGTWRGSTFESDTMIVRHDENYERPSPGPSPTSSSSPVGGDG